MRKEAIKQPAFARDYYEIRALGQINRAMYYMIGSYDCRLETFVSLEIAVPSWLELLTNSTDPEDLTLSHLSHLCIGR